MRVQTVLAVSVVALSVAGCGEMPGLSKFKSRIGGSAPAASAPPPVDMQTGAVIGATTPELAAPPPPVGATTVAALDTTTEAQKEAATAIVAAPGDALIGQTIISLGNPTEPGFWLRGGPVKAAAQGRVETLSGQSVQVDLMPGDGPAQLSLAAYQALNLNLTDLVEVKVFAR